MKKLVINADDLGMSDEVNRQIERCIEIGAITSTTLMANAPAFDMGAQIAKRHPQVSIGVHLNIIEFSPLTNIDIFRKHGMLDKEENFIDGAIFVISIDKELKQAIYEEWDAQITKIEKVGIVPTHCDSHQHTHTILELQEVLCYVLDKHKINRVRRKSEPSIRLMLHERNLPIVHLDKSNAMQPPKRNIVYRRLRLFVVKYYSWKWNRNMRRKYIMTDAFYSFRNFYFNRNVLRIGEDSSIELMCHPGNKPFQNETECLMKSTSWGNADYKLITYYEL